MITEEQQGPLFWRFVLCSFFLKPGHKQDHFGGKPLRRHTEDPDQCCIKEGRRGLGCGRVGRPGEDNRRQGGTDVKSDHLLLFGSWARERQAKNKASQDDSRLRQGLPCSHAWPEGCNSVLAWTGA